MKIQLIILPSIFFQNFSMYTNLTKFLRKDKFFVIYEILQYFVLKTYNLVVKNSSLMKN